MKQEVTDVVARIDTSIQTIVSNVVTFKQGAMTPADVDTLVSKLTSQADQLDAIAADLLTSATP